MNLGGYPCSPDTVLPGSPPAGAQLCVVSQPSLWAKANSLPGLHQLLHNFLYLRCPAVSKRPTPRTSHTHQKARTNHKRPSSHQQDIKPGPFPGPCLGFPSVPHVLTALGADPDLLTSKDVVCMAVSSLLHHQCSFLFWILPIST